MPLGCRPPAERSRGWAVGSIPAEPESPPGPRRRLPRGAGGQPASGDPVDEELRPLLRLSQLRSWCSPRSGGAACLSRAPSHRDKRYTNGSPKTGTSLGREGSLTLGHRDLHGSSQSSRPVHVWISPSGPPLCHNSAQPASGLLPCCRHAMPGGPTGQSSSPGGFADRTGPGPDPTQGDRGPGRHAAVSSKGDGGVPMGAPVGHIAPASRHVR